MNRAEYQTVTYFVVWRAELGYCDGGGSGHWSHTNVSEPFATEDAAWEFLKHHPLVIPDKNRSRYRHVHGMGMLRVRRSEEVTRP